MTKKVITNNLKTEFAKVEKLLDEISHEQLYHRDATRNWSIAENIQHLILASKPLVMLFEKPNIMLENWGKNNNSSRSYDSVTNLYNKHIGIPGFTTKHYMPTADEFSKNDLTQNFKRVNNNLLEKTLLLSEEDLDKYQIPHPRIGLMTCREFLYFTHYHTTHHLTTIKDLLKLK